MVSFFRIDPIINECRTFPFFVESRGCFTQLVAPSTAMFTKLTPEITQKGMIAATVRIEHKLVLRKRPC